MAKIWRNNIYYPFVVILFAKYCVSDDYTCVRKSECLCEFNNKNTLDISSINGSFVKDNATYSFSGCKHNVNNITGCQQAKLCKHNGTVGTSLGDDLTFTPFEGQPSAYNISLSINKTRTSTISLVCTHGFNYTVFTEAGSDNAFYIFSSSACIISYHPPGGLSTGSVLILLLFLGCVFYFVGGAIILHCIRGARGREIIPNIDFWQNLPSLVKDGLIFILNGCRPTAITTADSYDRI